jgi:hypothetical protein
MNNRDREFEEGLQAEAEAAERQQLPAGANASVDEYRLVLRALRQPLFDGLPRDFADRVARRAIYSEERGSSEDWIVTGLLLALAVGAVYYLQPLLVQIVGAFHVSLPTLPWPLLFAAALAVACAWAVDQGLHRRR